MRKAVVHRKLGNGIKIVDPSRVTTDECLSESCRAACSDAFICFDGGWKVPSASLGLYPGTLGFLGCRLHQAEPALELVATLASHSVGPSHYWPPRCAIPQGRCGPHSEGRPPPVCFGSHCPCMAAA